MSALAQIIDVHTAETADQQELTDGFHLVIDALKLNGIETIYGVPGIPITDLGRLAQAEGVRVDRALRGQRIGEKMMQAIMGIARERGCRSMQLKSDKRRTAAHRFYERIGMRMSHEAMTVDL